MSGLDIRTTKRVSRAGCGGFSVYLPKAWIDSWTDEQREGRSVEMFNIGEQLVLSPRTSGRGIDLAYDRVDRRELFYSIVSSYVNGYDHFSLESPLLTESLLRESRNIMRFLDENLAIRTSEGRISFDNQGGPPHELSSLLPLLFDRIAEEEGIMRELLMKCDDNPERSVHLMKMVHEIEKVDVNRLTFQIFRSLSRSSSPTRSFIDLNFKWFAADMLERVGDNIYNIVELICRNYSLAPDDLQYPAEYLLERVDRRGSIFGGQDHIRDRLIADLGRAAESMREAKDTILNGDGKRAFELKEGLKDHLDRMEGDLSNDLRSLWEDVRDPQVLRSIHLVCLRVREVLYGTKSLIKRAALVYYTD